MVATSARTKLDRFILISPVIVLFVCTVFPAIGNIASQVGGNSVQYGFQYSLLRSILITKLADESVNVDKRVTVVKVLIGNFVEI